MSAKTPKEIAPWMPEGGFWKPNHPALVSLFEEIDRTNLKAGAPDITREVDAPSEETRKWMWKKLRGAQHGYMEGAEDDKVRIPLGRYTEPFYSLVKDIRYGDHSFTETVAVYGDKEYQKGFVIGGTQDENITRLRAMLGNNPANENVREIILLSGQRERGKWTAPGESSVDDLFDVTQQFSGLHVDRLKDVSPFVKAELGKPEVDTWHKPFATEYEMERLATEAVFFNQIDWQKYPVDVIMDRDARPQEFETEKGKRTIPARTEALAIYHLKDGRLVYVINGKAVARQGNEPRATSDSIATEAVARLQFDKTGENMVFVSGVPHERAALDALTRVANLRRLAIKSADIVTGVWLPWKELVAGMGEIPATYKADKRLRAALAGDNPDSPELLAL